MSMLAQQATQMRRIRRRRAPRGRSRSSKNVLSPVKVAASGGETSDATDHEVAHESPLSTQKDASWTQSEVLQQQLNGYNLITVEEIEKCLRHNNETTENIGLKNKSQANMERYLNEQFSEVLFGRDILAADIDIDSAAKRLSNGYDNVYNESQNLYFSKEAEYVFSEYQLDNLDRLDYCTDEINLVDFSSPNGTLLPCNISNVNTKDLIIRLQETINKLNDNNKNTENVQVQNENCISENFENSSLTSLQDLTLENTSYNELNISNQNDCVDSENLELQPSPQTQTINNSVEKHALNVNNGDSTAKSKCQSSIITRRRALMNRQQNIDNNKESTMEKAKKNSISESHESEEDENFTLRPYSYLNHQEVTIAKALFEIGIKDSMLKHMYTPDKIKLWVCHIEDCERQFPKLCSLKTHLLQHYGVKPFKCDYEGCSWAFYADVKLKRHKETHLKKKNFVCKIPGCQRRFSTIYNLANHEKRHSRPSRLSCQVAECTENFQKKRDLELHMMSHSGSEPPYICSFDGCGKRFYTNNTLMAHRRCHSHSNVQITCSWPDCGKTFNHPCRLKTHMRFHTGTKPYACTFKGCKWAFSTASKLKRHQMKHTNDRKFACDVENCKKTFMRLEHLRDHKRTHDKQRLFQCNYCSSSFSAKRTLHSHIKKKHGNKETAVRRKTVEKTAEKKKTTRQKKEFVCSTIQPLRLTIKRVSKKSSADETETEKATAVQSTRRKSARINKNTGLDVLASSNSENKDEDANSAFVCPDHVKLAFQKEHNPPLTEIQNVTHLISSSPISQDELVTACTPKCLSDNHAVLMQKQADPGTQENTLDFELHLNSTEIVHTADNVGSARTALTLETVLSLKPNKGGSNSNLKVSDIVLDVANIGDGLMLSEDLVPFTCCQDDIDVPEYQILLFNTESAEKEISIQDLD